LKTRSLRSVLTLQSAMVAVIPTVAAILMVVFWLYPQIREEAVGRQQELATAVAAQVKHYLAIPGGTVDEAGALYATYQAGADPAIGLDALVRASDLLDVVYLVGRTDGLVKALGVKRSGESMRQDLLGIGMAGSSVFNEATRQNKVLWSDTYLSAIGGGLVVALAKPMEKFVVIGEVDLDQLSDHLREVGGEAGQMILLIDHRGQVIADQNGSYTAQQLNVSNIPLVREGVATRLQKTGEMRFNGAMMLGTIVPVGEMYWSVVVARPALEAFRSVLSSSVIGFLSLVVAGGLGGGIALTLSRRLSRRFEALTEQAVKVAQGGDSTAWPAADIREFAELSATLQKMSLTLGAREKEMSTLMANLPLVIAMIDLAGRISLCEGRALERLGLSAQNLIGKSAEDIVGGQREICAALQQSLEDGGRTHAEAMVGALWLDCVFEPLYDPSGRLVSVLAVYFETTERRTAELALRDSEYKYRQLFENLTVGFALHELICTPSGEACDYRFLEVNPAFERLIGVKRAEVLGRTVLEIMPELEPYWIEAYGKVALTGVPLSYENYAGVLGKSFDVWAFSPRHGQFAVLVSDVTDRKHAEEQLKQLNLELETRVVQRTQDLETANRELIQARDAAEAATRAKSEFLANMSHEIRTPINAVIGMTYLAMQTNLDTRQREYLNKARTAADSLLTVINDILDFSKIEAGKLNVENIEFQLSEVLDRIVAMVGLRAHEKKLELVLRVDADVPQRLIGDALRLEQVLVNLCNNAVKFTDAGEVLISVSCRAAGLAEQSILTFSIRDTGIGISQEQCAKLFQPFVQADTSSTRKYGGTGLGLAICRQLTELMGGHIWVDSEPGRGSEFSVQLGFGVPDSLVSPGSPKRTNKRVLVVDDSLGALRVMAGLLAQLDCRFELAESAEQGMACLEDAGQDRFDHILVDWKMPGMDGLEMARLVSERYPGSNFILMAAPGNELLSNGPSVKGIDGFLYKPVTFGALRKIVQNQGGAMTQIKDVRQHAALDQDALKGLSVLVVEDNEFNQQIARELLESAGVRVSVAVNGEEALAKIASELFAAVLMDVQMPVMDGYEAVRRIRAEPAFRELPVIAMTAHALLRDREQCLAAGMSDYISKPVDPAALLRVLHKWTSKSATAQSHANPDPVVQMNRTDLPGNLPGISIESGLGFCNDNPDFYRTMLKKFLAAKAGAAAEIEDTLACGDLAQTARSVHSLKSVAASLGANRLATTLAALEGALVARNNSSAQLAAFKEEMRTVLEGLHAWVQQENDTA